MKLWGKLPLAVIKASILGWLGVTKFLVLLNLSNIFGFCRKLVLVVPGLWASKGLRVRNFWNWGF
jgi:hypothetical protein